MHKEYILLNGFRKAKKGFTAGFHVPLTGAVSERKFRIESTMKVTILNIIGTYKPCITIGGIPNW